MTLAVIRAVISEVDPKAVEKARSRIRAATSQVEVLEHCNNKTQYVDTWYLYLVAAKGVYTALEQGAKISGHSRQWYGAMKKQRRDDELLQYMFQARNDEEHGLNDPIKFTPMRFEFGENDGGSEFIPSQGADDLGSGGGQLRIRSAKSGLVQVRGTIARMHLVTVTARDGRKYPPPTTHCGQQLSSDFPNYLARLNLSYLEWLTNEAEKLVAGLSARPE